MKKIYLDFTFNGIRHHAIARVHNIQGAKEYHVTVLNWQLERLLYGNHIISEVNDTLLIDPSDEDTEQGELKLRIASSLSRNLGKACFVGEQCVVTQHCPTATP
jgi:hypothetical protein